ncbi:MAG TPA: cytochrome c [Gemmatimonadales bacterium]|nr:cytochrome c [Gemmatimonadales bacterium]
MRWVLAPAIAVFAAVIVVSPAAGRPAAPDARLRTSGASARQDDLPDGEGKKILLASCTSCHDLTEVTKFRGYYDKTQWRDIVVTMKEYGAPIEAKQIDILADYLVLHLGRK